MKHLYSTAMWGQAYVDQFLNVCLATLLSDRNISAMARGGHSKFLVVTPAAEAAQIRSAPAFRALESRMAVEILVRRPPERGKYNAVSRLQDEIVMRSAPFDALHFVYPDFVFSDGVMAAVIDRIEAGEDAVVLPVPRVIDAGIKAELAERRQKAELGIAIAARDFVAMSQRHLHPAMRTFFWDRPTIAAYPSNLIWPVTNDNCLFRCFHLHPMAIRVQLDNPMYAARIGQSLDASYLPQVFPDIGTIRPMTDSDEGAISSLSVADLGSPVIGPPQRPDVLFMARWAETSAATLHRQFLRHAYRWHSGGTSEEDWHAAESASAVIADRILERLALPDSVMRADDYYSYRMRQVRAGGLLGRLGRRPALSLRMRSRSYRELLMVLLLRVSIYNTVVYPRLSTLSLLLRFAGVGRGRRHSGGATSRTSAMQIARNGMHESIRALVAEIAARTFGIRKALRLDAGDR